jgi:hypothetical protein
MPAELRSGRLLNGRSRLTAQLRQSPLVALVAFRLPLTTRGQEWSPSPHRARRVTVFYSCSSELDRQQYNETRVEVERRIGAAGAVSLLFTMASDMTTALDQSVQLGVAYTYRVRACNAAGFSGYSNLESATTSSSPTISGISPQSPIHSGMEQSVSVSGADFFSGPTVIASTGSFSTTRSGSQMKSVSPTSFVLLAMVGTVCSWTIRVVNRDGQQSRPFSFFVR